MTTQSFRTVLFVVFMAIFVTTAAITLLGVVGLISINDGYLKTLFTALVIELIAAVVALFRSAKFFGDASTSTTSGILNPRPYLSPRTGALDGTWTGTAHQAFGEDGRPFSADAIFTFDASKPKITGHLKYRARQPYDPLAEHCFEMVGGFLFDRFLRFEYNNVDKNQVHFGSIILELEPNSAELNGHYTGYGIETKKIIHGSLRLTKVA